MVLVFEGVFWCGFFLNEELYSSCYLGFYFFTLQGCSEVVDCYIECK